MKVKEVVQLLEDFAPLSYAEDFDNTGLLVGNSEVDVTGILVTLDTLESVVDEAISTNCNLIFSFHPIVFSGLKKITGKTYVERVVEKAIKNDIALFAIHTALDNSWNGVNAMICEKLNLTNKHILLPQKGTIKKLITFVPVTEAEKVREALFAVGAGEIGNYSNCSFSLKGTGSFHGNEASNPKIGERGMTHFEEEIQIGVTFQKHLEKAVLKALSQSHPYEEVAYEITTLENTNQHIGMGMVGELQTPLSEKAFLQHLKKTMNTQSIRHSAFLNKNIKKVAVLGGSGSFAIEAAKQAGADVFVSADFKYHDFFKAEKSILLADIGHYESEQYTKDLLVAVLNKKITNFAPALSAARVVKSEINTNPISYF
ncbi:dinuclear metal center YbgI/SA1388 family protein [Ulvibacter sp. MAR_2010_11]|uniref:Nif3-like dinuclear metal center hexameric protein n=1 Tax=Ulvibacter sp. MAR_2010_11 TaxID=1250229 RepID=UPI000C2C3142|nr:Nif3-like dinuclear metal center hexameric protein [Ulvibacter sp. MAR_2010_11]PKA82267.1 dinuclear metal center YbgI/SA1388 family protein [Ulvibacter sp. MAR_2010_11]